MDQTPKKPWWDIYAVRCPECDSSNVEDTNVFKYTYDSRKGEIHKYRCKVCKNEFWE